MDLTAQIFGRLTVLEEGERRGQTRYWNCRCICGKLTTVAQVSLRKGATQSCGCLHSEIVGAIRASHLRSRSPEYNAWANMRQRCYYPRHISYPNYGARGIQVCERWRNDFDAFFKDMGERPSPRHSLERTDNSKDYSPDNCRWATREEQGRNKRSNHYLTLNGETLTVAEWSDRTEIPQKVIRRRLTLPGWSEEKALLTPYKSVK